MTIWSLRYSPMLRPSPTMARKVFGSNDGRLAMADLLGVSRSPVWLTSFSSRQSAGVHPPARMVLNRGRRRRQKGVEPRLHDGVAFTRCLFQAWTIDDLDLPLAVVDETVGLHHLRGSPISYWRPTCWP